MEKDLQDDGTSVAQIKKSIKRLIVVHSFVTGVFVAGFWFSNPDWVTGIITGSVLMLLTTLFYVWIFKGLGTKKSVASHMFAIVMKYPVLAVIIYYLVKHHQVSVAGISIGVASFIVSVLISSATVKEQGF